MNAAALENFRRQVDPETLQRLEEPYRENERPEDRLLDLGLLDEREFATATKRAARR